MDLKELKAILKICRAQGVTDFEYGGVKIKFGDMPLTPQQVQDQASQEEIDNPWSNFPSGELTPEQLAFYSAGGKPEDDPYNKEVEQ